MRSLRSAGGTTNSAILLLELALDELLKGLEHNVDALLVEIRALGNVRNHFGLSHSLLTGHLSLQTGIQLLNAPHLGTPRYVECDSLTALGRWVFRPPMSGDKQLVIIDVFMSASGNSLVETEKKRASDRS